MDQYDLLSCLRKLAFILFINIQSTVVSSYIVLCCYLILYSKTNWSFENTEANCKVTILSEWHKHNSHHRAVNMGCRYWHLSLGTPVVLSLRRDSCIQTASKCELKTSTVCEFIPTRIWNFGGLHSDTEVTVRSGSNFTTLVTCFRIQRV
jgi:hypothetical protein